VGVAQTETATGRFVRINQKYCDILGYSVAEMRLLDIQAISPPEDLARDLAQLERLKAGEISEYRMEKRYLHKNGTEIWVDL